MTGILLTALFAAFGTGGLVLGRYVVPYREPVEDWSDRRLIGQMDRIRAELDLRNEEYWDDGGEEHEDEDWPPDPPMRLTITDGPGGDPDIGHILQVQENAERATRAPQPASGPNDPPDGWQPAPGDRIAAWARTGPRLAIAASPPRPGRPMDEPRVSGPSAGPGRPRSANRFMDLVAQHLTEYDLRHMQRAAA